MSIFTKVLVAQNENQQQSTNFLQGYVMSQTTQQPIAYATIYNHTTRMGTVSNSEGYFKIRINDYKDSVAVTMLGYRNYHIGLTPNNNFVSVMLRDNPLLIPEITVTAQDELYLYEAVAACESNQTKNRFIAKTYFELETYVGNKQIELIESYYHAKVHGYDIEELNLKCGRIGLQKYNDRFFVSVESSQAVNILRLFEQSNYFPQSPMGLGLKKLQKNYNLYLTKKYKDVSDHTILVIEYLPKDTVGNFFTGEVWVDSAQHKVLKITMKTAETKAHPFLPLHSDDTLKAVSMDITKTFANHNGSMVLNHIDFNYQINYKPANEASFIVSTKAILYAYDYDDKFIMPRFNFSANNISDYSKLNALPYNSAFWNNNTEFCLNDLKSRNQIFFNDPATITSKRIFAPNETFKKGLLEYPYITWNGSRISFHEFEGQQKQFQDQSKSLAMDMYDLNVKLFVDVNTIADTVNIMTAAVFDPYKSYYKFPVTNASLCFINIYFDLVEIERRELDVELQKSDRSDIALQALYDSRMAKIEAMKLKYFRETERGNNQAGITKWNQVVVDKIGINNIVVFNPYGK